MTKPPLKSIFSVFAVFVITLAVAMQAFVPSVSAAQITNRSLTLEAGPSEGGSKPGGTVNHKFDFTLPSTGSVGSIKFQYCTTAAPSNALPGCTTPTGLTTTGGSVVLGNESGATGFTLDKSTNGAPYLTRSASSITGPLNVSYRLDNVMNPSTEGTFFVRITTYASTDATGGIVDSGSVAASTAKQIKLDGTMPESLVFCAGATISKPAGVPDCSTATSGDITFNQLFSPTDTASAVSQMAASTNAGFGYAITVNGPTLTSGSNTIAGISNASGSASAKGTAQFGMNLVSNTTAAAPGFNPAAPAGVLTASSNIDLTSDGVNLNGRAAPNYSAADTFKFVSGNVVADSNFDATGDPDPTDAQIYTVSYIANVPGSQPAGTYTSTLTYICTPTF